MSVITEGQVVFNQSLGGECFHLRVLAPGLCKQAAPGQFVQVKVCAGIQPLLRTPLSVHDLDPGQGYLDLLYRVVGESTRLLSQAQTGAALNLLGPLGNGFSLPAPGEEAWLLAGGIGVAPLFYLARTLLAQGVRVRLLYGARTASELVRAQDFADLGVEVELSTDDGSCGSCGTVLDLLTKQTLPDSCHFYACGPRPMLKAVDDYAVEVRRPAQLSLEEYMACGIGACLGCVCATKEGGFAHVCTDGPVFPGGVLRI
ncbi:MAG: dihydroorotate dehydrogenase electron transfer subunit [Bacillota bacterium]|jgi:dihydroorotate dehydrogenase electron transfer subunit